MVEHWAQELEIALKRLKTAVQLGGSTQAKLEDLSKIVCECVRMVVAGGALLHHYTTILVTLAGEPAPPSMWDPALAEMIDPLLEMAAMELKIDPFRKNCQKRLQCVRKKWEQWCPTFEPNMSPVC